MNFPSKGGATDFKPLPAGSHFAVCDQIIDLGIQPGSDRYPSPKHKVYIRWQVPKQRVEYTDKSGQKKEGPRVIGKEYTASMHENANLRVDLVSWRGRDFTDDEAENFDVSKILGLGCLISVVHSSKGGKTYANIASIAGMPEGMPSPKAEGDLILFDPTRQPKEEADAIFAKLPEWLQKKINGQIREEDRSQESSDPRDKDYGFGDGTEITDDDIPF